VRLGLGEPEDDPSQAGTQERDAEPVECSGVGAPGGGVEHAGGGGDRRDGDRQVDQEDPLPRGVVDDQAADDRSEDRPQQDRHADQPERSSDTLRPGALRHEREPNRHDHAAAETLKDTEGDQLAGRGRECAQPRSDREQRDRGDPGRLRAKALGHPARKRDHHRQRQQVPGRQPLDRAERNIQVPGQRVERNVDDRRVEDRHDQAEGGDPGHDDRRPGRARRSGAQALGCLHHHLMSVVGTAASVVVRGATL
jgi:hypothetical protein